MNHLVISIQKEGEEWEVSYPVSLLHQIPAGLIVNKIKHSSGRVVVVCSNITFRRGQLMIVPKYNGHEIMEKVVLDHDAECAYHKSPIFDGETAMRLISDGRIFCELRCADLANVTNWWDL
jgi:hypothetical protein